jgi:hypothetical protein
VGLGISAGRANFFAHHFLTKFGHD